MLDEKGIELSCYDYIKGAVEAGLSVVSNNQGYIFTDGTGNFELVVRYCIRDAIRDLYGKDEDEVASMISQALGELFISRDIPYTA